MQSQTKIFSHLVRDYMRHPPVAVSMESTVSEALVAMADAGSSGVLVVDDQGCLHGIVTERDVTCRVALRCTGGEAVSDVMTAPARSVRGTDFLYTAIARMRRYGWRHMPVTDDDDRPLGMIALHDALAVAAEQTVDLIERIAHEDTLDGLREVKAAQVEVADALLSDNVPATDIQGLISDINADIHRRILDARIRDMAEEGWGEPPVAFAAIIMGSGGRGENFLYPDQDNGFVLADYPDGDHNRIDAWFRELAERMCRDLDAVGFPWCNGYVMAVNPLWRKTLSQWRAQIRLWGRRQGIVAIRLSDIFFDFQPLYGDAAMARELRRTMVDIMRRSPSFLQLIHRESGQQAVALGWFGRFVTERDKPEHKGEINLKHSGTLPLVGNIRLLALREGIAESSTLARIDKLREAGVLSGDEADYLSGAYSHISFLMLRQQIRDFQAGRRVGNYVPPDALSERESDILRNSFRAIDSLRKRMNYEMHAELF